MTWRRSGLLLTVALTPLLAAGDCGGVEQRQAEDGPALVLAKAARQPEEAGNGVLIAVDATGGNSLEITSIGGTHLAESSTTAFVVTSCRLISASTADVRYVLVRPESDEALVRVALFDEKDCTGTPLVSRILPVAAGVGASTSTSAADGEEGS